MRAENSAPTSNFQPSFIIDPALQAPAPPNRPIALDSRPNHCAAEGSLLTSNFQPSFIIDPALRAPVPSTATATSPPQQSSDLSFFSPQSHSPNPTTYELNVINTPNKRITSMHSSPLQSMSRFDSSPPAPSLSNTNPSPSGDVLHTETVLDGHHHDSDTLLPFSETRSPSTSVISGKEARNRATASSPIYGHVTGVLRGADAVHEVYRTREKPPPLTSSGQASKTFLEKMNAIFNQCENVSLQTGCWLFIGAQHANATGKPLHYASPRLRKEGHQNTNELATQFLQLIRQVSDARKVDVLELQNQLRRSERDKVQMEQSKKDAERKLQAAFEEIEALKARNQLELQLVQHRRQALGLAMSSGSK